eukprot:gene18924-33729_t
MLLLKRLECLLLLLLAGPARRVSAEFTCGGGSGGYLDDDTRACRKGDLDIVFGAKVGWCINGILEFSNKADCEAGAPKIEAIIQAFNTADCTGKEIGQNCGIGNGSCNSNGECKCIAGWEGADCKVAVFTCDSDGRLQDRNECLKEDLNAVFGAKVNHCSGYSASAAVINDHDDYDGPDIGCDHVELHFCLAAHFSGPKTFIEGCRADLAAAAVATNTTTGGDGDAGTDGAGTDSSAAIIAVSVVVVLSLVGVSVYCWKGRGTPAMAAAPMELVVVNAGYVGPVVDEAGYQVPSEYAQPSTTQMEDYDTGVVPGLHYAPVVDDSQA